MKEDVKSALKNTKEDVKQALQTTKEKAQGFGQDVKTALHSTKERAHELSHDVKTMSKRTVNQLKQTMSPNPSSHMLYTSVDMDE